ALMLRLPAFALLDRTLRMFSASNPSDAARTEIIFANARAVLAVCSLVAISAETAPMRNSLLAYAALLVYVGLSLAFLAWTRRYGCKPESSRWSTRWTP